MTSTSLDGFDVAVTQQQPGYLLPQRMGRALWAPMWLMALMGFIAAIVAAAVRADALASGAAQSTTQAQAHLVSGLMFVGFLSVFASISFAIARILGTLRVGGADVQQTLGTPVHTLEMPRIAKGFMALMMMSMMTLIGAVVVHFVAASATAAGTMLLADSESLAITLEAVRRLGVAGYLTAIALGLGAITTVLRFQAIRLNEISAQLGG